MATKTFGTEVFYAADINAYCDTTLHLIQEYTVTGSVAASFSITGISSTYKHLLIVAKARGDTALTSTDLNTTFNSDTGGNYGRLTWDGSNSAATPAGNWGSNSNSFQSFIMAANNAAVGSCGAGYMWVYNYADTTWRKSGLAISAAFDGATAVNARHRYFVWDNTAAINRIDFTPNAGNIAVNSTFSVYGVG